tara:strand:- start:975 stop:1817 length:843 start_codon:yes stop_codon:yes gene_type:complete
MTSIRVKKFEPTSITESRIIFLIGKRNTGKSVLMRDLLYHMPRPDFVLAMAPTESTLQAFREFIPECCIYDHFNQDAVDRLVSLQRELVTQGKKRTVMLVLDDCMYSKNVLRSKSMRSIFFNGRHDHISLICAAQYCLDVEPALRSNIDYVCTMRETILNNRQRLYKNFFGQFPKFGDFDKVMCACTQNFKCLILDGTVSSNDPSDSVRWYKASSSVPEFRLCKPLFWKWSKKYCLTNEEMRKAQVKQFQIETATANAIKENDASIQLVQTEDTNGVVVE